MSSQPSNSIAALTNSQRKKKFKPKRRNRSSIIKTASLNGNKKKYKPLQMSDNLIHFRRLLITGFIHSSAVQYSIYVPSTIINICVNYIDDMMILNWNISFGSEFEKFLLCKSKKSIIGPSFTIEGILFEFKIYPNGAHSYTKDNIELYIDIISIPNDIHSMTLTFNCGLNDLKRNQKDSFKSNVYIDRNKSTHKLWRSDIKLSRIKKQYLNENPYKSFHIFIYFEVRSIEYKDNKHRREYINQVKIEHKLDYKWKISSEKLLKFKQTKINKYYGSSYFGINNNWILWFQPCNNNGNSILCLKLRSLPSLINSITVRCIFKFKDNNNKINSQIAEKQLSYHIDRDTISWKNTTMLSSELFLLRKLSFTVNIQIIQSYQWIYKKGRVAIPAYKWIKFGIITDEPQYNIKEKEKQKELKKKEKNNNLNYQNQKQINQNQKQKFQFFLQKKYLLKQNNNNMNNDILTLNDDINQIKEQQISNANTLNTILTILKDIQLNTKQLNNRITDIETKLNNKNIYNDNQDRKDD